VTTGTWASHYGFRWGNGPTVGLRATADATAWLARFADVLSLEALGDDGACDLWLEFDRADRPRPPAASTWADGARCHTIYGVAFWEHPDHPHIAVCITHEPSQEAELYNRWSVMQALYRTALRHGGLPLHGALAAWQQRGLVIAAPGGTGKSTTLRRLPDAWRPLCDDEILMVPHGPGWRLHPMPTWSNFVLDREPRRWPCEEHVDLHAVCFLKHADTVRLERLPVSQAAVLLMQSARQILRRGWGDVDEVTLHAHKTMVLETASTVAASIPMHLLHLPRDGEFAHLLEGVLA